MKEVEKKSQSRNSSIELLKIIGAILIIFSHVFYTVVLSHSEVLTNQENIFVALFHCLGHLGNLFFFLPTCWFLIDKKEIKGFKIVNLILDVLLISEIVFPLSLLLKGNYQPHNIGIILFDSWYIIAYLIVYLLHPILNFGLEKLNQDTESKIVFGILIIDFLIVLIFHINTIITKAYTMVMIYVIVHYLKKWRIDVLDSKKINFICLMIGMFGYIITSVLYGLSLQTHFYDLNNISYILIAFPIFNFARKKYFYSKIVNWIASLGLFVYVFGENDFWKSYGREHIFAMMEKLGMTNIILNGIFVSLGLVILLFMLSALYKISIHKFVSVPFSKMISKYGDKIRKKLLKNNTDES